MTNLFSDIQNEIGKMKYQEYFINLMSEEMKVYIPYAAKSQFFEEINSVKPDNRKDVLVIVKKYDGRI
jgi:hypothetical protein